MTLSILGMHADSNSVKYLFGGSRNRTEIQRNLEEVTKISERHYRIPFSLSLSGRKIVKL